MKTQTRNPKVQEQRMTFQAVERKGCEVVVEPAQPGRASFDLGGACATRQEDALPPKLSEATKPEAVKPGSTLSTIAYHRGANATFCLIAAFAFLKSSSRSHPISNPT
jgi:hypothetical protein